MATLDGSARQVNLGQGISVRAPGLRGSAEAHNVAPGSTTRAPEVDGSGPALDAALARRSSLKSAPHSSIARFDEMIIDPRS